MRVGVKPGQWGWSFEELTASWRAAQDAGFDIVSCFDHVSAAPAGLSAWDAPSLLVAMAGETERITLAVDVLNVTLRPAFNLAGQLAVAQAASSNRLQVGLGAGSYHLARFDHGALGRPFPSLAERLDVLGRCCEAFRALWRGEEVTDPALGMTAAALGPIGIDAPPIFIGGTSRQTIEVAVRHADGWNGVVQNADEFATLASAVAEMCRVAHRRSALLLAAQVFVRDLQLENARQLLEDLEAAGAESVTFVLVEERGPEAVYQLAQALE